MIIALRIAGALHLAGGVLGATWYWDAFHMVNEFLGGGEATIAQVNNPWAITWAISILLGGLLGFLLFMALARILEVVERGG